MKKSNLVLIFTLTLSPFTGQAFDQGFNLGIGLGSSNFQLNKAGIVADFSSTTTSSSFTDSSTALTLYGGIQLDEHLSLDMDFLILGDITASQNGVRSKLFDVSSLAITVGLSQPLNSSINGFGRIGVHLWDVSKGMDSDNSLANAVDLTYGLGLDINVYGDRSRQMRLQWNHYDYDGVYIDSNDTFSISLLFLFGQEN